MKIKDIMTTHPHVLTETSTIKEAAELMYKNDIGAIPIIDTKHEKLKGIITDRDIIMRCISQNLDSNATEVKDIMTKDVISVCPENAVTESSRIMAKNKIRRLPVCENGKVVGMVSLGDISRSKKLFAETASAFCDICNEGSE